MSLLNKLTVNGFKSIETCELQLQRLNNVREGSAESLQLWAVSADGPPRTLGLLHHAALVDHRAEHQRTEELAQLGDPVTVLAPPHPEPCQ